MSASTTSNAGAGPFALAQRLEQFARHRWTPWIVNAVVLLLLSASLAQWTWKFVQRGASSSVAVAPSSVVPGPKALDPQSIVASNLFGRPDEGKRSLEQIPLSSLNVIVSGLMAGRPDAFALVSIGGAPEVPVSIGEELLSGVVLEAVHADRILVRRGGITESLLLKEGAPGLPAGSLLTAPGRPAAPGGISAVAPNSYAVDREWLSEQMATPEFLKQARIVPNAGGGFLVRNIQPGSLYDKFGLRVGDIIRSVNGQPVNSVTDVMRIYGEMTKTGRAGHVTLNIVRAGRAEQLTYNLQ